MDRPKIQLTPSNFDKAIEITGWIVFLTLITLPFIYYNQLPASIPTHFGPDGTPDAFDTKNMIWTLPIVGTILFLGMIYLNKFPHIFNYPVKITPENAEKHYSLASRLIRSINVTTTAVFLYLTYGTIQTALGRQEGLSNYFLILFFAVTFIPIGLYLYQSYKK